MALQVAGRHRSKFAGGSHVSGFGNFHGRDPIIMVPASAQDIDGIFDSSVQYQQL